MRRLASGLDAGDDAIAPAHVLHRTARRVAARYGGRVTATTDDGVVLELDGAAAAAAAAELERAFATACDLLGLPRPDRTDARPKPSSSSLAERRLLPIWGHRPVRGGAEVCPWNGPKLVQIAGEADYTARPSTSTSSGRAGQGSSATASLPGTEAPSLVELMRMSYEGWDAWTRGSAIRRAGYAGFRRNVAVAIGNWLASVAEPAEAAVEEGLRGRRRRWAGPRCRRRAGRHTGRIRR